MDPWRAPENTIALPHAWFGGDVLILRDVEKVEIDRFAQRLRDGSRRHVWMVHSVHKSVKARRSDVHVVRTDLNAAGVDDLEDKEVVEAGGDDDDDDADGDDDEGDSNDDDTATVVVLAVLMVVLAIALERGEQDGEVIEGDADDGRDKRKDCCCCCCCC